MQIEIKQIYCGQSHLFTTQKGKEFNSSYQKQALNKEQYEINVNGFLLDTQSDKENHGGSDKAICVYSLEDYAFLEEKYDIQLPNCAFGENLSIINLNDKDICLGDQFQYGETILEVSQPRQPCWKISSVTGIKKLTALIVKEYRSGFYLRVLKGGRVTPDDKLILLSRTYPDYTIAFINKISFNAKNHQEEIKEVLKCEKLAEAYRDALQKRYKEQEEGLQEWQEDDYN
jgi:MOSC domain-containing protein YiiM